MLVVSTSVIMDEVHVNGRCGEAVRHQSLGTRSISSQSECKDDDDLPGGLGCLLAFPP
jgi:hypothetical protein